jgi:26S proteasome regulatory subunit T6
MLRDELQLLQEPASMIGEVVKTMSKSKVLVKCGQEGKYVVEIDKEIDINACVPNTRVALRNDSYMLHRILPTKVDPLVSLMKVEKVPDASYDMVGGLDKQLQEIKEVIELPIKHPELFEALGVAQPKVRLLHLHCTSPSHSQHPRLFVGVPNVSPPPPPKHSHTHTHTHSHTHTQLLSSA